MADLIERYVFDVTRRLPERQRQEVGDELRVEIEAMADDEASGKKITAKHIESVLTRMGAPSKLAQDYHERQRYIISPALYGMYIDVLRTLLLIVLPIIIFFTVMGRLATVNEHIVSLMLHALGAGLEVAVYMFFWVTIIFFLVERFTDAKALDYEKWTPAQLPKLPGKQRISKADALVGMTWSAIAVWASAMQIPELNRMFAPEVPLFFSSAMWPWWTLTLLCLSAISLGAEIMKLIIGGWTKLMTYVIVCVNGLVIAYFLSLIAFVSPIVNPEFTRQVGELLDRPDISSGVETVVKLFVAAVVAISLYEIIIAMTRYIASKRRSE